MALDRDCSTCCFEDRVASADTRVLHGGTVTLRDLPVVKQQQNGDALSRLPDGAKSGSDRSAGVGESIVRRAGAYGRLVIAEESGSHRDRDHVKDMHEELRWNRWVRSVQTGSTLALARVHTAAISVLVAMSNRCCIRSIDASCCARSSLATQSTAITT
jgi:hypothetical protein